MIKTPVVILFFNRPDCLRVLLDRLAKVKPARVYLVCDGPRDGRADERARVEACKRLVESLPWATEIRRIYSDVNLGCRQRIISGLDWVFEQEERAIILEDDCIPIADFFPFCEAMLERYQHAPQVLSVEGTNLRPQLAASEFDVGFSKYAVIWGWATWRRAWLLLDRDLNALELAKRRHLLRAWLGSMRAEWYWHYVLKHVTSSWGYRWAFTSFINHGLHVVPAKSLVENIGMCGANSTHVRSNPYDLPVTAQVFPAPYRIPTTVATNAPLDRWIEDHIFSRSWWVRCKWLLWKMHLAKSAR
jgi:hypothetical protein